MLQAETGSDGELLALRYFLSPTSLLEVTRGRAMASRRAIARSREAPRVVYKTATIRSSLFAATDAAGIPDAIAMQIARVFAHRHRLPHRPAQGRPASRSSTR